MKILKIDKGIFLINDKAKVYKFLKYNRDWAKVSRNENGKNKRHIIGYKRLSGKAAKN